MRILLVRHGQTDWHNPKRAQGWTEVPLNDTGRAQATALGEALKGETIDRVIVSDLGRAQDTARALGRPYET
ncbi:histidine phosphatase family protein, partial [bacterium]